MKRFKTLTAAISLAMCMAVALPAQAGAPDAVLGQKVFQQKCAACHTVTAGARNGVGPNLFGIVGKKAGSVPGYAASPALKASGIIWDAKTLSIWLDKPSAMVPRNKMGVAPPLKPDDKANLIGFLKSAK